jgi:hypothetical protein
MNANGGICSSIAVIDEQDYAAKFIYKAMLFLNLDKKFFKYQDGGD